MLETSSPLTLDGLVRQWAQREPDRPLLRLAGQETRACELFTLAQAAAAQLAHWGIGPGDRLALWGQNSVAWVAWLLGASQRGAAIVALHPSLTEDEFRQALAQSRARWLVLDANARGRSLREIAARVTGHAGDGLAGSTRIEGLGGVTVMEGGDGHPFFAPQRRDETARTGSMAHPSAAAALLFTSGSSGRPKLVQLAHRALVLNALRTAAAAGIGGGDRIASPLPLYHAGGLSSGLVLSLATGALWCTQPRFDAGALLADIRAASCTVVQGVPTMFKALIAAVRDGGPRPTTLRLGFAGAATVAPSLSAAAREELGLQAMCVTYGQSEFGPTISMACGADPAELATVGQPIDGVELRIVDPATGASCGPGDVGEIQVRGDTRMDGYLDDPQATRDAIDAAGWLRTGDLGVMDGGRLRLLGRLKALIIRGGENISAGEIEDVLALAPGVQEVCVVPVPSAHWGEAVCAVVQPVPGQAFDREAVMGHAAERLSRYKRPEHLLVWPALPLLSSGKIDRRRVRDEAAAQLAATQPEDTP